jgi:hypothetical protein
VSEDVGMPVQLTGLVLDHVHLGYVCSCFSADFFSRKAEKSKGEINSNFFNWFLKR